MAIRFDAQSLQRTYITLLHRFRRKRHLFVFLAFVSLIVTAILFKMNLCSIARLLFAIIIISLCSCFHGTPALKEHIALDPDMFLNATGLIRSKGYPAEEYKVQTQDGYILTIHRIPHGRTKNCRAPKLGRPIYLQHGLLSSSADWVVNFPNQSLGFLLADAGFDVWLGNFRGNVYSREHVNWTSKDEKFWHFSFDEMIKYDLPAMINFVLKKTNYSYLPAIGHSEGTTTLLGLLAESKEFNKKINPFIALAPVATVGHIKSPIKIFAPFSTELEFLFDLLGHGDFLPNNKIMKVLAVLFCDTELKFLCSNDIFLIAGVDPAQLNTTRLPVYVAHSPAGTSTLNIVHYAQMVRSKKFAKFDYGWKENYRRYGQVTPPEYYVENITTPVALFWSLNDLLADPTDVALLEPKLKNLLLSYRVPYPKWSHIDFIWGLDAATLVYKQVFKILEALPN